MAVVDVERKAAANSPEPVKRPQAGEVAADVLIATFNKIRDFEPRALSTIDDEPASVVEDVDPKVQDFPLNHIECALVVRHNPQCFDAYRFRDHPRAKPFVFSLTQPHT